MNVDILGIIELRWTGMGEFNSEDHYISSALAEVSENPLRTLASGLLFVSYYCGQESLRRNGVAIMVNKRVQNAVLGCNLKSNRTISVRFQGKPFNIMVIQVYAPTSNTISLFNFNLPKFHVFWVSFFFF